MIQLSQSVKLPSGHRGAPPESPKKNNSKETKNTFGRGTGRIAEETNLARQSADCPLRAHPQTYNKIRKGKKTRKTPTKPTKEIGSPVLQGAKSSFIYSILR